MLPLCTQLDYMVVSGQFFFLLSVQVALKERKKERMRNGYFLEHLVLACTIDLMNDLGLVR